MCFRYPAFLLLVVALLLASLPPLPSSPRVGRAEPGLAARAFLPIVFGGWCDEALTGTGDQYEIAITAGGFEPPYLTVPPGSTIVWRNRTAAPVTLVSADVTPGFTTCAGAGTNGGNDPTGSAGLTIAAGTASQPVAVAGTGTLQARDRPDQRIIVEVDRFLAGRCPDTLSRPSAVTAWAAPAALDSPLASPCTTSFQDSAPAPVTKMVTATGDVRVLHEYLVRGLYSTGPITSTYLPGTFSRDYFGQFSLDPFESSSNTKILVSNPTGWASPVAIRIDAVTEGIVFRGDIGGPVRGTWGTCTPPPVQPIVAPFDSSIYAVGSISATLTVTRAVAGVVQADGCLLKAIELEKPPMSFDGTNARRIPASDIRYRVVVGNSDLGEFTSHIFRPDSYDGTVRQPADLSGSSATIQRPPFLAVRADRRGGVFYPHTGEYVAPVHLFSTQGLGIAAGLDLHYSSLDSLLYRGAARLPKTPSGTDLAEQFVPTPFGQGWSSTYGIRVLKRADTFNPNAIGSPSELSGSLDVEVIGPAGERTLMKRVGSPASLKSPEIWEAPSMPWVGAQRARLEATATGFRLWSPDARDEYLFDTDGRLTQIGRIGYENPLTISYSATEQVVTDSGGKVTRFQLSGKRVVSAIDPLGQTWTFGYTNDSLTSVTHGGTGYRWRFAYNAETFLLTDILEPDCRLTHLTYAAGTEVGIPTYGAFTGSTTNGEMPITVAYPVTDTLTVQAPDGGTTTYQYGRVGKRFSGRNTGTPSHVITDTIGQVHLLRGGPQLDISEDPAGRYTRIVRDSTSGVPTTIIDAMGADTAQDSTVYVYESSPNALTQGVPVTNTRRLVSIAESSSVLSKTVMLYDSRDRVVATGKGNDSGNLWEVTRYEYDAVGRTAVITDAEGRLTRYTYGTAPGTTNLVATETSETAAGERITVAYTEYDGFGNAKTVKDERGNLWRYDYDTLGRLVKTTAPDVSGTGPALQQYTYDPLGRPKTRRDARGYDTSSTYDSIGRIKQVTYPDGSSESWDIDEVKRVITHTNQLQGVTTASYDAAGQLQRLVGPSGQTARYTYDGSGNATAVSHGGPGEVVATGSTVSPSSLETTGFSYDFASRVTAIEHPTRTVSGVPFRAPEQFTFQGDLMTRSSGSPQPGTQLTWNTDYDGSGRPRQLEWAGFPSYAASVEYDATGLVTGQTGAHTLNQQGMTTRFGLDGFGRLTETKKGNRTPLAGWRYDAAGNPIQVLATDPSAPETLAVRARADYDARGQLVKATDASGRSVEMAYDANGNLTWMKDQQNCATVYSYDSMNRIERIVQQVPRPAASGGSRTLVTDYRYDKAGNQTAVIGPYDGTAAVATAGRVWVAQEAPVDALRDLVDFDAASRPLTITMGGRAFRVEYRTDQPDLIDRLVRSDGKAIKLEYDEGWELKGIADETGRRSESWQIDGLGRHTVVARGEFTKTRAFNSNWFYPTELAWTYRDKTYTYQLSPDSRFRVGQITDPDGKNVTYQYDNDTGRIKSISRGSNTWTYAYYPNRALQGFTLPNGISVTLTYCETADSSCQPGRVRTWTVRKDDGTTLIERRYQYLGNAQVTFSERRTSLTDSSTQSTNASYQWDAHGLKSEDLRDTAGGRETRRFRQYCYGPAGDRTVVYSVDPATLPSSSQGPSGSCDQPSGIRDAYDYVGQTQELRQITAIGAGEQTVRRYQAFDPDGQVKGCTPSSTEVSKPYPRSRDDVPPPGVSFFGGTYYEYDESGRLIYVRVPDDAALRCAGPAGGAKVEFDYLASGELARRQKTGEQPQYWVDVGVGIVKELDESFATRWTYLDEPVTQQKLARWDRDGSLNQAYLYDPEGRVALTVDADAAITLQPAVSAFGEGLTLVQGPFGFGGRYQDPDTGLVRFAANAWYEPVTGRFLQPTSNTLTPSPYQFVGLAPAPATAADPGGLSTSEILMMLLKAPYYLTPSGFAKLQSDEMLANFVRRHETLRSHGLSESQTFWTNYSLTLGEPLGLNQWGEAVANFNAQEGREVTWFEWTVGWANAILPLLPVGKIAGALRAPARRLLAMGGYAERALLFLHSQGIARGPAGRAALWLRGGAREASAALARVRLIRPPADAFSDALGGANSANIMAGTRWTHRAQMEQQLKSEGMGLIAGQQAAQDLGPNNLGSFDWRSRVLRFRQAPTTLLMGHERGHQFMAEIFGRNPALYENTFSSAQREYFADLFAERMAEFMGGGNPQQLAAIRAHKAWQRSLIPTEAQVRVVEDFFERSMRKVLARGSLFR